jgi:ABC-type dipeptide/oligopeptide/nickel transport system permease subunit
VRGSSGPWTRAWRRLLRNRVAISGAAILLLMLLVALLVPLVEHIDPHQQNLVDSLLPPGSPDHPLGTDQLGRDLLLRLIDGARVSLGVGLIAVSISAVFGALIGLMAGFRGGWVDRVLMRLMDVQLAFPGILAALVIVTVLGGGLDTAMVAVGLGGIPRFARIVRGSVLALRHQVFVDAARSLGASDRRIMLAHVAPRALGPLITLAALGFATALLATASLSFLGLGAQPPTAEWGLMLADGRKYLRIAWWMCVFPGSALLITVLAINLLGDGLRDALDPQLDTYD